MAGLSISGLLLPEAIAYSGIANLPPQAGIIALLAGMVCYGLLGKSRFAIVSATSSSAVILAAAAASLSGGDPGLRISISVALVLLTGLFFLVASLARLGNITDFIARPVLRGFAFGLAIVIIIKQFAAITETNINNGNSFSYLYHLFSSIRYWNLLGLCIASGALVVLFAFSRFRYIPAGLIVIALGIVLGSTVDLPSYGVSMVGNIDLDLQKPVLPMFDRIQWFRIGELGLALSLVLYSESYGSIHNFAVKHGDNVYPNRDLFALGVSNIVSGLFNGMPVGAGYSGTSANEAAGASSRAAGMISALVIIAIIAVLLPVIAFTPQPVFAAIVIHAVSHTLRPEVFSSYFKWKRDRIVVVTAVIGVLVFGVLDGLLAAIVISIAMLLKRFAETKISVLGRLEEGHDFVKLSQYPAARAIEGTIIFRPDEPLFFANSEQILSQARQHIIKAGDSIQNIVISLEESPDIDSSTIESFSKFFAFITEHNKRLVLARVKDPIHEVLSLIVPPESRITLTTLSVDDAVKSLFRTK